ncbi:hypothetical protein D3C87_278420 [compost metagenome]
MTASKDSEFRKYFRSHGKVLGETAQGIMLNTQRPIHAFKALRPNRWNKYTRDAYEDNNIIIANLIVPTNTKVFMSTGRYDAPTKSRAEQAYIHSLVNLKTGEEVLKASSDWDPNFRYFSGGIARVKDYNPSYYLSGGGIYLFLDLEEAKNYLR